MAEKQKLMKAPEVIAAETLIAILSSDSMQQAADALGISRQAVYKRINQFDLTEKIKQLREEALLELTLGTNKAARKLVNLVDSDNDGIAKAASDSILDRVGITKVDNKGNTGNTYNFTQINNEVGEKYDD